MYSELQSKSRQREIGGIKINYYEGGSGPSLVLLHGQFGDYLDWAPVLEPLGERFHVVAVDLPGFGQSDKPDAAYTGEFFVDTLDQLFSAMGLTNITLAGNSFGGQIAILYALRHPDKVERLILVNSGGFRDVPEAERAVARTMLSAGNLLAMPPAMIPLIFARVFVKESEEKERYIAKQTAKLKAPDYPAYVRALVQAIELSMASYLLDELPKIGCPILLLAGRKDAVVPLEQAEAAARRAPRAELQIMENSGHVPQLEDAEELVKRVTEFAYKKAQEPIKQSS